MFEQLLTKKDLQEFRTELIDLLKAQSEQRPVFNRWLKTVEVRKLLKISPGTLQTLRDNGTLQYSRLGGVIYYDAQHIEKLLHKNLVKATRNAD